LLKASKKEGALVIPYVTEETLGSKTTEWLERIRPWRQHDLALDVPKAALLVVDMQRFFLDPDSPTFTCGGPPILPTVVRLIEAFRAVLRPVLFTRHVHHPADLDAGIMGWWWKGKCVEGSPESEIHPAIAPRPDEKVVLKHRYSAFYGTDLETVLRCLRIEDLVIAGIMTNMCCESTARDAYYRDLRVFVPADGTGAVAEEMHVASLLNLAFGFASVTTAAGLLARLAAHGSAIP
jgi:nicotinamidase-related amidase